jgi:hypothetical protein
VFCGTLGGRKKYIFAYVYFVRVTDVQKHGENFSFFSLEVRKLILDDSTDGDEAGLQNISILPFIH